MPSSYTTRIRATKQAAGENANTWGTIANEQTFDMIDEALDGYEAIAVAANVTLSSNNGATDQARKRYLKFTGAGGFTVTIPNVQKVYHIYNACAAAVTISTGSGTTASVSPGKAAVVACEGGNVVRNLTLINDGAGAWTQIATTAASGTSVTFSGISQLYSDLMIVLTGVKQGSGANAWPTISLSHNSASYSPAVNIGNSIPTATEIYGGIFVPCYLRSEGIVTGSGAATGAAPAMSTLSIETLAYRLAGAITDVRLAWSTLVSFTGGTITLYAR